MTRISHSNVGGLTTGSWRVFSSTPVRAPFTSVLKCKLSLILRPTYRGNLVTEETNSETLDACLKAGDQLPVGPSKVKVIVSCVFVNKQLVVRSLQTEEFMDCFDMEVDRDC